MYIYLKGIELVDKVTENVKQAKKPFVKLFEPFDNRPLSAEDYHNINPYRSYVTDGQLLLLEAVNDLRERFIKAGGGVCFVAILIIFTDWSVGGKGELYYMALYLFLIGFVPWLIGMRLKSTRYFVFNRTAGTVLFPAKWRCPPLILPFGDVSCHPSLYFLQFGGIQRTSYLCANKVTQNEKRRVVEIYLSTRSRAEAERDWSLVCTFMDLSQPLPDIPAFSKRSNYYKKHNLSLREVFSKPVHENFLSAHLGEELEEPQK